MELVDTHCHLDFERFDADRDAVVERARRAGVRRMVVPGLDLDTSAAAIALTERYDGVFAAVGVHPNSIGPTPPSLDETMQRLAELAVHPKVVAVGEIGLDYHWDETPHPIQHTWLAAQLALAGALGLPVILHNRESTADLLALLQDWVARGLPEGLAHRPGVLHSFSAGAADAAAALRLGFYLGFTGPLTFKNADELRQVAASAPADRIVVETDSPFLTPHPHRGERNEPAYVQHVAEALAAVRGIDERAAAQLTTANAGVLFGWADGL